MLRLASQSVQAPTHPEQCSPTSSPSVSLSSSVVQLHRIRRKYDHGEFDARRDGMIPRLRSALQLIPEILSTCISQHTAALQDDSWRLACTCISSACSWLRNFKTLATCLYLLLPAGHDTSTAVPVSWPAPPARAKMPLQVSISISCSFLGRNHCNSVP